MAEAATAERPNKVKITDAGPCKKKIAIEVPAETVTEHLGTSLDTLSVEAELPGFRKGRAPRRLIEKKFGTTVRKEAKNQIVAQAYSKAIEEHKLRVVGEPFSEELAKIELEEGKPLSFEIEVEVPPTFEKPNLEAVEVRKPLLEVTDEMVNQEIDRMKLHEGDLEEQATPTAGDYLTGHAVMKDEEGATHLDLNDAVIQIPTADKNGKGMILGVMVDDLGSQIGDKPKPGDTITVKTIGPENHETEAVRGKKLTITFEVKRADRILPLSGEKLAERFGFENEEAIREAVRQRMQQRVQTEQQSAMRQQVAKHLLDTVEMELPERVTAMQSARNLARTRFDLMNRGVDAQQIEEHLAELRAGSSARAVRELKLFFILDTIAEDLGVTVSDAELNGQIAQMAMASGQRPEKLRQDIINRNQVGMLYTQVRESKTMDAILGKAKVTEMPAEEFNKFIEEQNKAGGESKPAKKTASKKAETSSDDEGGEEKADKPKKKAATKKKAE